jgi:2-dehydropantoate 2-reductase
MRIAVVGAGGIGGIAAAELVRSGADVTLVDANRAHVEAIRSSGLQISGARGDFRVGLPSARLPDQWTGTVDAVLLAVKSQHTDAAVRTLLPHLSGTGTVVSLQNGWNAARIAALAGAQRTVAAMVHVVGSFESPGRVTRHTEGAVYLGELDGSRGPRTDELARLLAPAFPTHSVRNVLGYLWCKQVYGATMPVNALVDVPASQAYRLDWVRCVLLAVVGEALDAATAEGVVLEAYERFDPAAFRSAARAGRWAQCLDYLPRGSAKGNSGVWRDLRIHRRRTEIDHLTGELVRIGRRHGLPMRVNAQIADTIADIERGRRQMDWANLRALAGPAHAYLAAQPWFAAFLTSAAHTCNTDPRRTGSGTPSPLVEEKNTA